MNNDHDQCVAYTLSSVRALGEEVLIFLAISPFPPGWLHLNEARPPAAAAAPTEDFSFLLLSLRYAHKGNGIQTHFLILARVCALKVILGMHKINVRLSKYSFWEEGQKCL